MAIDVASQPQRLAQPPVSGASQVVIDGKQRLLARYDFEDGGNVEVRVTGGVDTDAALDMVETLIGLKRAELARREKRQAVAKPQINSDENEDEDYA